MLLRQLTELEIRNLFDEIIGADNIHANGKLGLAKLWRSEHPDAVPLMIGDTDHDAETAKTLGADIILVTWGHQSEAKLSSVPSLMMVDEISKIPFDRLLAQ